MTASPDPAPSPPGTVVPCPGRPAAGLLDRVELRLGAAFWIVAATTAALRGTFVHLLPYGAGVAALFLAWPIVRRRPWAPAVLDWLPLALVVVTYDMLHAVVPRSWDWTIDPWLREADRALLGADAVALLGPVATPALTVFLSACYLSYYVVPTIVGIAWWRAGRRTEFRELMVGVPGLLFVGYLGYLLLPATGPHVFLPAAELGPPLQGDFASVWIRSRYEAHEGFAPRDAFPSLHTANAVTMLLVAWRRDRRVLRWVAVPMLGLVAATVVLRFHWVVDVLFGAALAVAWQPLVERWVRGERARV